ncbi:hypothetical protein CASFOL_040094 [Castilleja foliolosa]|uniref:Uncharacterized protein n=1 Tax=Castilleja foliolosa TaxID=1961234 RepID=A0ABD3BEH3_9LAMI
MAEMARSKWMDSNSSNLKNISNDEQIGEVGLGHVLSGSIKSAMDYGLNHADFVDVIWLVG